MLDVADPPVTDGRYHRQGRTPTWYGSSSEAAAWAELLRNPPGGVDPKETRRRIGRVTFDVVALDLTDQAVRTALGIALDELIADSRAVCQSLADRAIDAGFEAILAPSAATPDDTTLAVFGAAIAERASDVVDLGTHAPPG